MLRDPVVGRDVSRVDRARQRHFDCILGRFGDCHGTDRAQLGWSVGFEKRLWPRQKPTEMPTVEAASPLNAVRAAVRAGMVPLYAVNPFHAAVRSW